MWAYDYVPAIFMLIDTFIKRLLYYNTNIYMCMWINVFIGWLSIVKENQIELEVKW